MLVKEPTSRQAVPTRHRPVGLLSPWTASAGALRALPRQEGITVVCLQLADRPGPRPPSTQASRTSYTVLGAKKQG